MIEIETHPSWALTSQVQDVCRPLFEKLKINYVDYSRFYEDGRVALLYTDQNYVKYFLEDEAYSTPPNQILTAGFHLWSSYIDQSFLSLAANKFHHAHGITVVYESAGYKELLNFATTPENITILSLYLNQQDIMRQIVTYFRDKTKKLIHKVEDHPLIILPEAKDHSIKPLGYLGSALSITDILPLDSSGFHIHVNNVSIALSKREAQCLFLLYRGNSAKEIARVLNISPRTIEMYLDKIRFKTSSKSRIDLLTKLNYKEVEEFEKYL